jgi:branched-chain amino acid transport system ATP-binding protein
MAPILLCEGVAKAFGALRAVDGVTFAVEAGETFGIAGPNGSGKSTLFNVITGVPYQADAGRVIFERRRIEHMAPHRICHAGIARTFQKDAAFPALTVRQNVRLGVVYGRPADRHPVAGTTAEELLAFVGIAEHQYERPASEVSLFDRKKLMIASALAVAPRLLLLDEPASGLTQPEIKVLIGLIRKLKGQGVTVLVIEHVLSMLLTLSERLMVLNQGQVLTIGSPNEVVRDPAVVEAYLGSRGTRAAAAA